VIGAVNMIVSGGSGMVNEIVRVVVSGVMSEVVIGAVSVVVSERDRRSEMD